MAATLGVETIKHTNGTTALTVGSTGNVTVSGDIIKTTAGTSNFAAGVNAGNSIQSGGNYNTVVGDEAGTAVTTGDNNTLIGYVAGDALTTATDNVAVGHEALTTSITGGDNVAVGGKALKLNTASDNTACGYQALRDNSSGHSNVAVGKNALKVNTTANNNTAVGYNALAANTEGFSNTAFGSRAGDAITTGDYNTAVGNLALSADTTGAGSVAIGHAALTTQNSSDSSNMYNTAVGNEAGTGITTGIRNSIVGYRTLASTTTGYYNTAIGYQAGDDITDGFRNICIGHDADVSAGTNQHTIVIGESITAASNDFSFGKASNVVTNDFDADANWSRSSDERLKKNITNQTLGLDFINDLRTVKYNWKASNELDSTDSQLAHLYKENADDNEMNTSAVMHNFIAQEVKAALDTAGVSEFGGWKEDQYGVQQVSREMFVIPLVKAVQELSAKNDALEARLAALEA